MRVAQRSGSRSRAGVTLLEVVLASSLLATALGAVAMMSSTTENAYQSASATLNIERNLHRALHRAAEELATTGNDHLNPPNLVEGLAFETLEFQPVIGSNAGLPLLGGTNRLALELAENEVDDGLDNDGDGLVDEQDFVFYTDVGTADQKRTVLCHHVLEYLENESPDGADENGNGLIDEPGFHVVRTGNLLTLRLSSGGFDHNEMAIVRTAEIVVRMRN